MKLLISKEDDSSCTVDDYKHLDMKHFKVAKTGNRLFRERRSSSCRSCGPKFNTRVVNETVR